MNIKKDYIEKTKEYLEDLRKKINRKQMLNDEIKILKKRQSLRMYELYSRELESIGKDIINLRYLESKKQKSFAKIAKEVKYSRSSVANKHDEAIETLAFYIFGDEAVYN